MRGVKKHCVYMHHVNGVPFYVGMGAVARAVDFVGRSPEWRKMAENAGVFDVRILLVTENLNEAKALEREMIETYGPVLANKIVPLETNVPACRVSEAAEQIFSMMGGKSREILKRTTIKPEWLWRARRGKPVKQRTANQIILERDRLMRMHASLMDAEGRKK